MVGNLSFRTNEPADYKLKDRSVVNGGAMAENRPTEPEFPIRILFDDGDSTIVDEPDDLFSHFNSIDSADPTIAVRDSRDRNVRILMTGGEVMELRIEE
jgi:hypothetical protein